MKDQKEQLNRIIDQFKDKRIIVWGDLILDEYIFTTTGRISREAPVLVTEFEHNEFKLGGAGNVVMNIGALGATPIPVGFVGANADGKNLKRLLKEKSITTDYLVELEPFRTPKKSRILSGGENTKKQQVLRIDSLNKYDIPDVAHGQIEKILSKLLADTQTVTDFLIVSDYIYESVHADVYFRIKEKFPTKTIIIDSRKNLPQFKGVTIATPNEPEIKKIFPMKKFYSEEEFLQAGHQLLERLEAKGIILKRGHEGMMIFQEGQAPVHLDIHGSSDIVDVTGAGDTVISVLSLALATGSDLISAARLANIAAGFVVMKDGAYPIHSRELKHELDQIC